MALPVRREDGYQRENQELQTTDLEHRAAKAGSGWYAWWWPWLLLIVAAVIWFAGWGWHGYGGWLGWGGQHAAVAQARSAAQNASNRISQQEFFNKLDKLRFDGRAVQLRGVEVLDKAGRRGLWVGPNLANPVLVILPGGKQKFGVGDTVSLTGVIHKAPDSQQAQADWGLNVNEQTMLQGSGIYIKASSVRR
jgi:hypothetical protein